MGGFVLDVESFCDETTDLTLTAKGVAALARQGYFVNIDPRAIEDKSKANVFTKLFICIQVSWMVIQCIARSAAGYPLSLLEIHTMVHVACALMVYVVWWSVSNQQSLTRFWRAEH